MNANYKNFADTLIYANTAPNEDLVRRMAQTAAILNVLAKATEPMTASEIMLECGDPINYLGNSVRLPDGTRLTVQMAIHALKRLIMVGKAFKCGSREIWYDVDDNTKKRSEVSLYALVR